MTGNPMRLLYMTLELKVSLDGKNFYSLQSNTVNDQTSSDKYTYDTGITVSVPFDCLAQLTFTNLRPNGDASPNHRSSITAISLT